MTGDRRPADDIGPGPGAEPTSPEPEPLGPGRSPMDARLLGSVVAHARDSIVITDARLPDTRITYVNPAFEAHTGYARDEVIGQTPRFLQGPETSPATLRAIREATERREPIQVEILNYRKDGAPFWIEMGVFPAFDEAGGCTHFVSIQREITDRKNAEIELQRSAEALARAKAALEDKTTELESHLRELEVARDLAEAAARAKSAFAANVSHELRTPLNGVLGMVSLLQDTRLDEEQQEYLGLIRSSGEALLSVISDVLDLGKIESGRLELERRRFSVRRLIEDAVAMVAVSAHEKDLELGHTLDPSVPEEVWADDGRLRQVLVNLLGNAVKFTDEGHVETHVTYSAETAQRGRLRVEVRDTGPGIARDKHASVFEPFVQADISTTRNHGGTGLGLTIVQGLVDRMGGRVWVKSEVGRGSAFGFDVLVEPAPKLPFAPKFDGRTAEIHAATETLRETLASQLAVLGFTVVPPRPGAPPADLCVIDESVPPPLDAAGQLRLAAPRNYTAASVRSGAPTLLKPVRLAALETGARRALGLGPHAVDLGAQTVEGALRILVAEDNRVNERVVVGMLSRLGHVVAVARDGAEALDALSRDGFDLVLMDLQMPKMDGLEVTIRYREQGGTTPIVALTANAQSSERERCLAHGMQDYLTKPVRRPQLLGVLRRFACGGADRPAPPIAATADLGA